MRLLDAASSAVIAGIVFAATNFWNPLGWLTFAGALWKFCKPIILDEDPYAKAKQKMRESLTEAKQKGRADFDKGIRGITERLDQSLTEIRQAVDTDLKNLKQMNAAIDTLKDDIRHALTLLKFQTYEYSETEESSGADAAHHRRNAIWPIFGSSAR